MAAFDKLKIAAVMLAGAVLVSGFVLAMALNPALSDSMSWRGVTKTYAGGVSFTSPGERLFGAMQWRAGEGACPVVLHLPNGDVALTDMTAPLVLRANGWTQVQAPVGSVYQWRRESSDAELAWAEIRLENAQVREVSFRSTDGGAVSVCGKRVALPAASHALDAAFGAPVRVEERDHADGAVTARPG